MICVSAPLLPLQILDVQIQMLKRRSIKRPWRIKNLKSKETICSALLCSAAYAVITLIWRTDSFIWISEFKSATTAGLIETDEIISRESYSY